MYTFSRLNSRAGHLMVEIVRLVKFSCAAGTNQDVVTLGPLQHEIIP